MIGVMFQQDDMRPNTVSVTSYDVGAWMVDRSLDVLVTMALLSRWNLHLELRGQKYLESVFAIQYPQFFEFKIMIPSELRRMVSNHLDYLIKTPYLKQKYEWDSNIFLTIKSLKTASCGNKLTS